MSSVLILRLSRYAFLTEFPKTIMSNFSNMSTKELPQQEQPSLSSEVNSLLMKSSVDISTNNDTNAEEENYESDHVVNL